MDWVKKIGWFLALLVMRVVGKACGRLIAETAMSPTGPTDEVIRRESQSGAGIMDEIRAEARRRYPQLSEIEAMDKVAKERSEQKLATQTGFKKQVTAASTFEGMYFKFTNKYAEVCSRHGVGIGPFTSVVAARFSREHSQADSVLNSAGIDGAARRKLYQGAEFASAFDTITTNELTAVGEGNVRLGCETLRDYPEEMVGQITVSEEIVRAMY